MTDRYNRLDRDVTFRYIVGVDIDIQPAAAWCDTLSKAAQSGKLRKQNPSGVSVTKLSQFPVGFRQRAYNYRRQICVS